MNRRYHYSYPICIVLMILCILFVGCVAGPDPTFTAAARDYQSAVAPEYLRYVEADPALDAAAKARRQATVARFEEAIVVREARAVQR
ncbi:MAG: hypothetical protein RJA36_809 [Pseudomonadota bacterium]|jgi:hypothetical protein